LKLDFSNNSDPQNTITTRETTNEARNYILKFVESTFAMIYEELTGKIIGCAMAIHSSLGSGFPEAIYQRSLQLEMQAAGLDFIREMEMTIFHNNIKVGTRRVDFFVERKVMVELKAMAKIEDLHLAQAVNYLEAYKLKVGLLLNFGANSLQFKRLYNNKL